MIEIENLSKSYKIGGHDFPVLRSVSTKILKGEFVALTGPSGSGKTSLMNIIGLLDTPTAGRLRLDRRDCGQLPDYEAAQARNILLGFVFQAFHLLPHLTVLENVALPLIYRGHNRRLRREIAEGWLERVGLGSFLNRRPSELSGGQRQRVAIARALVGSPQLLLADEPTGNLDSEAASGVMDVLYGINQDLKVTVLLVTHDRSLAEHCPRRLFIEDGRLAEGNGASVRLAEAGL